MRSLSGLRLNHTGLSDQLTALMLVGVAAVIVGGVGHNVGLLRQKHDAAAVEAADEAEAAALIAFAPITIGAAPVVLAEAADTRKSVLREQAPAAADLRLPLLSLPPVALLQQQPLIQKLVGDAVKTVVAPEHLVRTAELKSGETLGDMLIDADLGREQVHQVLEALRAVHNLRKLPEGLEVTLQYTRTGNEETFEGLTLQPDALTEVHLRRVADGFKAEKVATPVSRQRFAVHGVINATLYEAGAAQGVPRNVMAAMIRAFSHEVDFQRDLHPGSKYRVFYEQPRTAAGDPAGEATIIYAALEIRGDIKSVYRVLYNDGTAEYFNGQGESVRRNLMRTPVDGAHVSSSYGMRRHPVLGYSKMHKGVDFAAPSGTPIFAAGDGVVKEARYNGSYGRFVLIRHGNGLETAYAHMSRFARGIRTGSKVRQGDVIAYVGSTGRSTGPHLHFEVRSKGRQVNPMSINMRARRALGGASLAQFNQGKQRIKAEFEKLMTASTAQKHYQVATAKPAPAN